MGFFFCEQIDSLLVCRGKNREQTDRRTDKAKENPVDFYKT